MNFKKVIICVVVILAVVSIYRYERPVPTTESKSTEMEIEAKKYLNDGEDTSVSSVDIVDTGKVAADGKPLHDFDYYKRGSDFLREYVKREDVIRRLNRNEVSEAQREYFLKILDKLSLYQLRAVDMKLAELEKRVGS